MDGMDVLEFGNHFTRLVHTFGSNRCLPSIAIVMEIPVIVRWDGSDAWE